MLGNAIVKVVPSRDWCLAIAALSSLLAAVYIITVLKEDKRQVDDKNKRRLCSLQNVKDGWQALTRPRSRPGARTCLLLLFACYQLQTLVNRGKFPLEFLYLSQTLRDGFDGQDYATYKLCTTAVAFFSSAVIVPEMTKYCYINY